MKSVDPNTIAADPTREQRSADGRGDPFARITSLARGATSRPRFMADVLRAVGAYFASPYAAVHLRFSSEVVQDDCHFGPTNPGFWKASLQEFLTESLAENRSRARLLRSKQGDTKVAFLSSPLYDAAEHTIGAIALVVHGVDEQTMSERLATLNALCRLASFCCEFIGRAGGGVATVDRNITRGATYSTPVELAFAITNELRNKLGCEQVALGWVRRRRVRLLSISGFDQIVRQSPGVVALVAAMEECFDLGQTIVCGRSSEPSPEEGPAPIHPLHRTWQTVAGGASVASVPLCIDDQVVAVVSLRNRPDHSLKAGTLSEVRELTQPFMPLLVLLNKASRGVVRHTVDHLISAAGTLVEPGRWGRRIAVASLALATLWFVFGTMPYVVTGACVVKPGQMRHLSAPVDGVLAETLVVAGDRVAQGQLLCRFDDRDLRHQEAQWAAEWEVLERRKDRARSANAPVEVKLAEADQTLARIKLDIVRSRLARLEVRAPFDGIVTSGDLRHAVGAVLPQGTPLFAVAPLDDWAIEIEVPEFASADVAPRLRGEFASLAQPEYKHLFEVARVIPHADVRHRKNVIVAEATLNPEVGILRPGMEGVASIHVGRRPAWWVALHRVIDYVRLKLWW